MYTPVDTHQQYCR